MSWYVTFRPEKWDDVVGCEEIVASLKSLVASVNCPHSFLFVGKTGSGKTTLARILGRALGATVTAYHEINVADLRGVDTIREISAASRFRTPGSPVSAYVFDELHQMTTDAQQALLKVLEDAPAHAYYILCTTNNTKIVDTIRNRCIQYVFPSFTSDQLLEVLLTVEAIEHTGLHEDVAAQIIALADGSPRAALTMFEKIAAVASDVDRALSLLAVREEDETTEQVKSFVDAVLNAKDKKALPMILGRKNLDVKSTKLALMAAVASNLTKTYSPELSKWIMDVEQSLFGANTLSGLLALVFRLFGILRSARG